MSDSEDSEISASTTVAAPTVAVPRARVTRRKEYEVAKHEAMHRYPDMNDQGEVPTKRKKVPLVPFQIPVEPKRTRPKRPKKEEGGSKAGAKRKTHRKTGTASRVRAQGDGDQSLLKSPQKSKKISPPPTAAAAAAISGFDKGSKRVDPVSLTPRF
jgi:hypothetical protein